ncbi:MAG: hypothetical protein FRX49_07060 [Trebouxia sp. A1-2]|nr:MAG: hypothetical protein FRX49_07060 [Trebouxia sp. A1-2]
MRGAERKIAHNFGNGLAFAPDVSGVNIGDLDSQIRGDLGQQATGTPIQIIPCHHPLARPHQTQHCRKGCHATGKSKCLVCTLNPEAERRPHRGHRWIGEGVVIWWTGGVGRARAVVPAGLVAPDAAAPVHPLQTAAVADLRREQERAIRMAPEDDAAASADRPDDSCSEADPPSMPPSASDPCVASGAMLVMIGIPVMLLGSVVGWPAASYPTSAATCCPALSHSTRPNQEAADVAMSTTTEPLSEGTPMAKGLVPKMASVAPCGVTYSGDWESTMPIMPLSASCFAQYLYQTDVWGLSGEITLQLQSMPGSNRMHDMK